MDLDEAGYVVRTIVKYGVNDHWNLRPDFSVLYLSQSDTAQPEPHIVFWLVRQSPRAGAKALVKLF